MPGKSSPGLLSTARISYARGLPVVEIAKQLGVNAATVYRWKAADARSGVAWETLRGKAPVGLSLVYQLEGLLADVVQDATADPVARARAVADLHRVLQGEREYEDALHGVARFISWCASALSPEQQATVTMAAGRYLEQVRGVLAGALPR